MKRTPLERKGAALARQKPLRRRTRPGAKRKADPVTPSVYALVMARDGGCVAQVRCKGKGRRLQWHHRLPVEHGGPSTVENGASVCAPCHWWVHKQHPDLATERGWLVDRRADPATTPMLLPDGRRVLLTPDGTYRET